VNYVAGYRMTTHALERQREMGVKDTELARALTAPEQTYRQSGRPGEIRQAGRISAVVSRDGACLTVLWRTTDRYERAK
jgi:hypothetical protein